MLKLMSSVVIISICVSIANIKSSMAVRYRASNLVSYKIDQIIDVSNPIYVYWF